jgi:hypothetical protein
MLKLKIVLLVNNCHYDFDECLGAVQCWQHLLLQCSVAVLGADTIPSASAAGNE